MVGVSALGVVLAGAVNWWICCGGLVERGWVGRPGCGRGSGERGPQSGKGEGQGA